ncbi:hypothetical protein [Streptomyces sp. 891-h]|uniref:hypothetical protein n=1 Tax=Streptomyces sp. 891-h TaxID=2720714 RepID=UPI001FAA1773|nr:hypothetical protein [Streptomyces sp. 891-h]UNZ16231.1 hypothetical protein HC362_03145 [Streptomyces sp. 891-h]
MRDFADSTHEDPEDPEDVDDGHDFRGHAIVDEEAEIPASESPPRPVPDPEPPSPLGE